MIYHFNALFSGNSIGRYYNQCCRIVPLKDDWICLWDSDIMLFNTFNNWNGFLERAIKTNPDVALFTCMANRIGTHKQRLLPELDPDDSMRNQRILSEEIWKKHGDNIRKDAKSISGMMMLFKKGTWLSVGGFCEKGILDVDKIFSRKIWARGWKIGILQGMYVMHYYRLVEGNKNHLLI